MRRGVLWDSSAVLALIDADDADHERAVTVAERIAGEARPCFVTNYIQVEAHALLLRKLGRALAREWLFRGGLPVLRALPAEEARATEIIARHEDKDWSLCDAIAPISPCRPGIPGSPVHPPAIAIQKIQKICLRKICLGIPPPKMYAAMREYHAVIRRSNLGRRG